MTTADRIRKVQALRRMTVANGATPSEAATAAELAARMGAPDVTTARCENCGGPADGEPMEMEPSGAVERAA